METFKLPKRKRRLRQKKNDSDEENIIRIGDAPVHVTSLDDLFSKKKRRLEAQKKDHILEQLFENLKRDVEEKEKNGEYSASFIQKKHEDLEQSTVYLLDFDDHFLLNCEKDSDNEEIEEEDQIKQSAKLYLEEDDQEHLDQALEDSKKMDAAYTADSWHHDFFIIGMKNIRQPSLISRDLSVSQKETHISELSATSRGRSYLLQTGCLKDWFHSGWKCPNYIYQWLFEVVGLEINTVTAKNALSTLFELWSTKDDMMFEKYIELQTFKSVLLAYDTIPAQLIQSVSSSSFMSTTEDGVDEEEPVNTVTGDDVQRKNIPLSQLGWMIKAFSFSIRLFTKAYTTAEIRYTIRILLQISIDKTGYLVIQDIQTAIDNCLSALEESTWETEVKTIANDICDVFPSNERQMHLLDSVKTMNQRSRYFRRMIGLTGLERAMDKDVPGSTNYISTHQSIIKQIAHIFNHPEGFFKNTSNIDYGECYRRVALLDAAIGTDENDIKTDKNTILDIADHLRFISLQMGARLGVMKKTLANEMIQRVWSRISYAAGRKADFEL